MSDRVVDRPSSYRMYDYLLGGSFHFAVDRAVAREVLARVPWVRDVVKANRAFLIRAVRFAVSRGVRQFLDLGSGIISASMVDRTAQALDANCRVAYVDSDPIAVAHADVLTDGNELVMAIQGDLRDVPGVLSEPAIAALLDFTQPVGLLLGKVLHRLPDKDRPADVVAGYRDAVPAGSTLAISHATMQSVPDAIERAAPLYRKSSEGMHDRPHAAIRSFFDGWDIVEPGLVFTSEWRPDSEDDVPADPGWSVFLAGVGIKP